MSIVKDIIIKGDSSDAVKSIKDIKKASDSLTDSVKDTNKEIEKTKDTSKKAGKSGNKAFKLLGSAVKGVGTAFKALGIGLVVAAFAALANAMSKNQKVMDGINSILGTIGIVFTQISNVLIDVYENVSKSSENFNALGKVMSGLLTLAITPLKAGFFGIKLAIQQAQLIWEKSFFGGKDIETIAELNVGILETKNSLLEVAEEALSAGKTIVNNFGEAITEASNITNAVIEGVSKISVKAAFETAKANVHIENSARLAAAQQGRLVEQFDRAAELQRQARDNESKSIADRTKANDALLVVLEKQEKAMLSQADLQIADAVAKNKINNNIETQVALTEALANKEAILAQITGFKSEQDVNRIALLKEEIELNLSISDAEKERRLAQLEFDESQEENAILKLEKQRERLEEENQIIIDDLERKRGLYEEGTQARTDAEQDYLNKKQVIDNAVVVNEKAKNKEIEDDAERVKQAKIGIASATLNVLGSLAKEGSALAKGVAASQALINTYQGVTAAMSAVSVIPEPMGSILKVANAVAVGVAGLINVKKILSTQPITKSAPSSAGSSVPPAPSFNLVAGSGSNQIAQGLASQQQPIQAVVVSGDVTTAQSVDRNIVTNSTI